MTAVSFAHLHVHTEYSMLDGAARITDVVTAAAADGQPAIAITDHGVLYGVVDFVKAAREAGIKPIIGIEAYFTDGSRFDRPLGSANKRYHMNLLAENEVGYRNLLQLSSKAYLEGYYYKPRMDFDLLSEHAEGIIATSGCLGGLVPQLLAPESMSEEGNQGQVRDFDAALAAAGRFQDIFGSDNFFIEIQDHGLAAQKAIMPDLLAISKQAGAPLLATNDAHYTRRAEHDAQDVLLCIQTGSLRSDPGRLRFEGSDHYLKTSAEMRQLFSSDSFPGACDNTLWIAERAEVELEFGKILLPHFPVPVGETELTYLRKLVDQGTRERYGPDPAPEVWDRVEHELKIIEEMGFSAYFLIVWDLIRYARENRIRVGPGRGSAAGSIVSYCLRITDLDPLAYGLIFERFLNPGRREMPDIDMDFDERYRADVIKYAAQKYGSDRVAQIVTFSTIKGKQAIRDAARVLGHAYGVGDRIAKAMPPSILGREPTLDQVLTPPPADADSTIKDWYANAQGLRELYEADDAVRETVDAARGVEGLRRQDSIHAAAVVIGPEPLINIVPIQQKGEGAEVVTQYEMYGVQSLGLLKMDFLGLRNLSIIERCLELVEETSGSRVDIDSVPLDDEKTFELLQSGHTIGVFQLEGTAMRSLIRSLKPDSFNDVIASVALYRPGPMGANMHNLYADRKNGRAEVEQLHPALTDKLADTYQIMVYQEQVMTVAQEMAGYSMVEADDLRRAMGKKIKKEMVAQEQRFVQGCMSQGHTEAVGKEIFGLIEHFAGYGFNRCLTGDTTVVEAETGAIRTLRELYDGRVMPSIASLDGWMRVLGSPSNIWQNGVKPVFKLTTRSGRTIRATGNHPFRTVSGWRPLEELGTEDFVAISAGLDWLPTTSMTPPELTLLGYVIAEGNTCHPSSFYIYSGDEEVVQDAVSAMEGFENTRATVDRSKSAVSLYAARVDLRRPSGAVEFIERSGLRHKGAIDKRLPDSVDGLPRSQLARLLAAMWSGDGCCNRSSSGSQTIYYATSSPVLAEQVAHLLLRLGIRNTLSAKSFRYRGGRRPGYQIHVITDEGLSRFATMIGPYLVGKRRTDLENLMALAPAANNVRSTHDQVPARQVFPLIRAEATRAMTESGRSLKELCLSGGFTPKLVHSLDPRKRGYRRDTIAAMAKAFESTELRELADADVWWDRVVSIVPDGLEMTYDLEVPGTHNFVADDFVVHNSHSAAYGLVAYQTAYLKAHHPAEYMAALLTATKKDKDRTAVYLNECRRMGIKVLVPDVNESGSDFTVHDGRIRFGLSAVRNVGDGVVERIIEARSKGPFPSLQDFVDRVDVTALNKRTMESLIKAGAFDASGDPRRGLAMVYEQILDATVERRRNEDMGQFSLFAGDTEAVRESRIEIPALDWPQKIALGFEKEMLGLYVSDHPLLAIGPSLAAATTNGIRDLEEMADRMSVTVGGLVASITRRWTRKGDPMIFFQLEDLEGSVEVMAFPRTVHDFGPAIVEDAVVVVVGNLDNRGDDVKVIAREIKELEVRDDYSVRLQVAATRLSPEIVTRLKGILANHPGSATVFLHMLSDSGTKVLRLSDTHRVEPRSALFAELKELLGQRAVI